MSKNDLIIIKTLREEGQKVRPEAALLPNTHVSFSLDPLFAEHPAILPFLASGSKMQRMRQQKLSCILASVKVSLFLKLLFVLV